MSKQQKTTKPVFSSKTKLLPPKQLGQKLVVNTKNLGITVGLEFEKYDIEPALSYYPKGNTKQKKFTLEGKEYHEQLKIAKEAKIINALNIQQFFPKDTEPHEFLAVIQKTDSNGQMQDFLAVTFDDNVSMGKLEFISIGSGILPANLFFAEQNLNDIKNAVDGFAQTVHKNKEKLNDSSATLIFNEADIEEKYNFFSQKIQTKVIKASSEPKFEIKVFESGAQILQNITFINAGAVHVTHTFPLNLINNKEVQNLFISDTIGTAHTNRRSFDESRENKLDILKTSYRTNHTPNPKTPVEFLSITKDPSTPAEQYANDYREGKVLYPMSNIAGYMGTMEDKLVEDTEMARYNAVLLKICEHHDYSTTDILQNAAQKIERTKLGLNKVKGEKQGNDYLFQSYEEKLQPLIGKNAFLVEHRDKNQLLTKFCANYFKYEKYNEQDYNKIVKEFQLIDTQISQEENIFSQLVPQQIFQDQNQHDKSAKKQDISTEEILQKLNQFGNDMTLGAEGTKDPHYWYSIMDLTFLLKNIREKNFTYLNNNDVNQGEEYGELRESQQHILLLDPYYTNSFDKSFHDTISRITGDRKGQEENVENPLKWKWDAMPTTMIIPVLEGVHWRNVRIQIDYNKKDVYVLWDDPYGANGFKSELTETIILCLQTRLPKLFQMHYDNEEEYVLTIKQTEKLVDQQGVSQNGWDCGLICLSNVRNYVDLANINQGNEQFVEDEYFTIKRYDKEDSQKVLQQIRLQDLYIYSQITEGHALLEAPEAILKTWNETEEKDSLYINAQKNLSSLNQDGVFKDIGDLSEDSIKIFLVVLNNYRNIMYLPKDKVLTTKDIQMIYDSCNFKSSKTLQIIENEDLYGTSKLKEGLNPESIKVNLDAIIDSSLDKHNFYIAPKVMNQEELLSSISDWQNILSTYYGALIKLENASGDKHAVLFYASKAANHLAIRIIDPLSEKASTFKLEIENLAQLLRQERKVAEVAFSGRQDEDYGTCADISLIMLQELIEQATNKPILDHHNQTTVGNFDKNYTYDVAQFHNFDYDNPHPALLGQDHHDIA